MPPPPVVSAVTPDRAPPASEVAVEITGSRFYIRFTTDAGPGDTDVNDHYSVALHHTDSNRELSLGSVEWHDPFTLFAAVPPGIPRGRYSLTVDGPYGRSNALGDAYEVCDDPDGDGACQPSQSCGDACDTCTDEDGDGWGRAGTEASGCANGGEDCDDTNDSINPGSAELPGNNSDEDCDGVIDCYVDGDGDGYGRNTNAVVADDGDGSCLAASGESLNAADCDDDDATVFPGMPCDDGDDCTARDLCDDGQCLGYPTCAGVCSASCVAGCGGTRSCCIQLCPGGDCATCESDCSCDMSCDGVSSCQATCNADSTCHLAVGHATTGTVTCAGGNCLMDCHASGRCLLDCQSDSHCEQWCDSVTSCELDCQGSSTCLVHCSRSTCELSGCAAPVSCTAGVVACNRPCP